MRRPTLPLLTTILVFAVTAASAGLPVKGQGDQLRFDPSGFPAEMKKSYELMEVKCANPTCHTLERTVQAINTGVAPMTKTPFDKQAAKAYGVKMMRKPDSGVNKDEAKNLVELMYFLIDEAQKK